jgi:hypothetical protein
MYVMCSLRSDSGLIEGSGLLTMTDRSLKALDRLVRRILTFPLDPVVCQPLFALSRELRGGLCRLVANAVLQPLQVVDPYHWAFEGCLGQIKGCSIRTDQ